MDVFSLTANSTNGNLSFSSGTYDTIFVIVIVSVFIIRRVSRGVNGTAYNIRRVLRPPLVMAFLFVIFSVDLISYPLDLGITILAIVPGAIIGDKLGRLSQVYLQNNIVTYKRNPILLAGISILTIIRLIMEFEVNLANTTLLTLLNALIGLSLGIYLGEFFNIKKKAEELETHESDMGAFGVQGKFD